jgi:hypothetical protein
MTKETAVLAVIAAVSVIGRNEAIQKYTWRWIASFLAKTGFLSESGK